MKSIIILSQDIIWNKIVLRAEVFDAKHKKGLAMAQAIQQPHWGGNNPLTTIRAKENENNFTMRITSRRFLNMTKNNSEINIFLTENGGFTTSGWLNSAIEVIDKPHIIYATETIKQ